MPNSEVNVRRDLSTAPEVSVPAFDRSIVKKTCIFSLADLLAHTFDLSSGAFRTIAASVLK